MKVILKIISLLLSWGAVAGVILYVDLASIRDIGIEGAYLPFLILIFAASFYTWFVILKTWKKSLLLALLLELLLVAGIFRLVTWFLLVVIILAAGLILSVKKAQR